MVSKNFHPAAQSIVLGDGHSGVAERPEILGWIEAEIAQFSNSASALDPVGGGIFGANRLGRIFNHRQTVARANRLDFIHWTTETEQVDRSDCSHLKPSPGPNGQPIESALRGEELPQLFRC